MWGYAQERKLIMRYYLLLSFLVISLMSLFTNYQNGPCLTNFNNESKLFIRYFVNENEISHFDINKLGYNQVLVKKFSKSANINVFEIQYTKPLNNEQIELFDKQINELRSNFTVYINTGNKGLKKKNKLNSSSNKLVFYWQLNKQNSIAEEFYSNNGPGNEILQLLSNQ
jgi:hypothetical protein